MKNNNSLNFKSNINRNTYEPNSVGKIISFALILLLTGSMMYILNKYTHFTSDDFRYHYMYESFLPEPNVQRIQSFSDIVKSMYNHYNMWGGRITAHTLVQFILMFDKQVFNIINSLAYVGLIVLIYLHCNVSRKINIPLLLGIIFSLWFFIPQFGLTVLWVSGAGNYLWCTIIILLFLLPYRRYYEDTSLVKDNIFNFVLMIFIGILAGWTNENTGGAMILLTMLFAFYFKFKNIKIPKWAFSGFFASCIGFVFLALSPGNNARKAYLTKKTVNLVDNFLNVVGTSFTLMFGLTILLLLILSFFLIVNNNNRDLISKNMFLAFIYVFSALAGIIVLIFSPQIPARTWFGPIVFFIIAIGTLFANIDLSYTSLKPILVIGLIAFSIKYVNEYTIAYKDIEKTYKSINAQISIIEDEKAKGNLDIVVNDLPKRNSQYNAFKGTRYLFEDKDAWLNQWMAKYYDINSIRIGAQ